MKNKCEKCARECREGVKKQNANADCLDFTPTPAPEKRVFVGRAFNAVCWLEEQKDYMHIVVRVGVL